MVFEKIASLISNDFEKIVRNEARNSFEKKGQREPKAKLKGLVRGNA